MYLGQTVPYLRSKYQHTLGDQYGAMVAEQDIVRAVLESGLLEAVHIFLDNYHAANDGQKKSTSIYDLQQEFGQQQIRIFPLSDLPDATANHQYTFLTHGIDFQPLGEARLATAQHSYPLCALVHSINAPSMLTTYLSAALFAEPYDSIVVTSEAGYQTVKKLWEGTLELLQSRLGNRTRPEVPIVKIPLGVDTTILDHKDQKASRELLQIPTDRFVMLYVGRLTDSEKADLEPLIDILKDFLNEGSPMHLVLAGQDRQSVYSEKLEKLAMEQNISQHLTIIPNFPYFLKAWLFSAADVFISPSDNIQETFGIAVAEAMACELPVIASNWSGYRDLVTEGETGFLVPTYWYKEALPYASQIAPICDVTSTRHFLAQQTVIDLCHLRQALKVLLKNQELRINFGKNGRDKILRQFSWPVIVRRLVELWGHQWDCLQKQLQRSKICFQQDYNELFSHFATQTVHPDTILRRSSKSAENIPEYSLRFTRQKLERVLYASPFDGISFNQLRDLLGDASMEAVVWLWKKGYLEISE